MADLRQVLAFATSLYLARTGIAYAGYVPDSRSADFARYGMLIGSALDGIRSLRHARQLQAGDAELTRLFEDLFELRRREPREDILSHLVAAEGDQVTPEEILPLCTLLLVAGFRDHGQPDRQRRAGPAWQPRAVARAVR
jgi:cytochrome P450